MRRSPSVVVPGQLFQYISSGSHWYSRTRVPFSGLISISLVVPQSSLHLLLPGLLLSHCNKSSGILVSNEGFLSSPQPVKELLPFFVYHHLQRHWEW